ncbi:glycoside-pentoside-hexuronide (GPH):cation symporter [Cellulomonas sp. NPDC058312]|uniref:glycoside-pentoside-hexuronide (GPH):cation symporter n=1 Tax=Cellulomonas sp. NPDC058312 TaxID=3346441 RepID=UPI0036E0C070
MTTAPEATTPRGLLTALHDKLPLRAKVAYGLGDMGNGFMFDLGQAYLLKFYTDVAGLNPAAAAGVFVFTKIFDAFMDPVAGIFVDRRPGGGRHGRFKPVMMYASIALGTLTVVTFLTPGGTHGVNLVYAYLSYMAWGVLYSFTNVPYGSLASVMTQNPAQRAQLASFRQAGSVTALLITGVAFMPIVHAFGNDRVGFAAAAGAMSVVGVLGFFATFRGTKEVVPVARTTEKITPRTFATTIGRNRALLVLVLMTVFSISAYNIKPAMIVYFTDYNLHNQDLLAVVNFFGIGSSILAILTIPFLVAKFGKRNVAIAGFALAAVADGLNFLLPTNTVTFTILYSLSFVGVALPNGITWALVSDAIDYGHWRTGVRREGITYSMFNFSRKIAQAVAGGAAGFGLSLIGYVPKFTERPELADQADGILQGIKGLQTLYPCLALTIAGAVLFFLYPLTDARITELVAETRDREAGRAVADEPGTPR